MVLCYHTLKRQLNPKFSPNPNKSEDVPSLGAVSESMSIMEPTELKKFLPMPIMGENRF